MSVTGTNQTAADNVQSQTQIVTINSSYTLHTLLDLIVILFLCIKIEIIDCMRLYMAYFFINICLLCDIFLDLISL